VPVLYIYFDRLANRVRRALKMRPKMKRIELEQELN